MSKIRIRLSKKDSIFRPLDILVFGSGKVINISLWNLALACYKDKREENKL